ncbi:hypothetical protein RB628_18610 [Streptomyces sp. ADMS]|nr:hypothetical protein [Streptomyces sp. ADMS]MDW4907308.1 hypothetical protein [Streptomyces sp. ADMS]
MPVEDAALHQRHDEQQQYAQDRGSEGDRWDPMPTVTAVPGRTMSI